MNNSVKGVYVEILSECNARCTYCYNEKDVCHGNNVMSPALFAKIADNAKDFGTFGIAVSGGEPMLHPNLVEIIESAYAKNMALTVISNFTLFNKEIYDVLCKYNVTTQVTLDGPTSEIHDFTRGNGTFEKTTQNIAALFDMGYRGELHVRMNLHRKNYQYLDGVVAYATQIGAAGVALSLVHCGGGGANFNETIESNEYDILHYISDKTANFNSADNPIKVTFEGLNPSIGCPYYGKENIQCGLRIASDGHVYPCQLFIDKIFSLGSMEFSSLKEIINGEKMERFLNLMQLRKHFVPECNDCAYKKMCASGCPAEAYNKTGNIFASVGKCDRNKNVFKNAISSALGG